MIFVDEAGSNLGMTLLYARSEKEELMENFLVIWEKMFP